MKNTFALSKISLTLRTSIPLVLCSLALCTQIATAAPVILDFEGVAPDITQTAVGNTYTEDGYRLYNPGQSDAAAVVDRLGQNTTGSDYYTWDSPLANNPVTLTAVNDSLFSLNSLDIGSKDGISLATFSIIGHLSNGNTILYQASNVNAFSNVSLSGFNNLSSVTFAFISGDFGAIDNLAINTVPEPTTVALLGLGLLGFAASRRKAAKK
jgi:hypothetical protein